ncbi:MAG: energy transducer TonB [Acidobacteria bacterium]|nr:energy transducer TonB [Acidobacteriota bacterium]
MKPTSYAIAPLAGLLFTSSLLTQTPTPTCPDFSNVHEIRRADIEGTSPLTAPRIIDQVQPEYSEEARRQKITGDVLLSFVVDVNGKPKCIQVVRPLGHGLDEKAIEAVSQWRFRPAMKEGKPVPVQLRASVFFKIYGRR